jgi:hypothetical protein
VHFVGYSLHIWNTQYKNQNVVVVVVVVVVIVIVVVPSYPSRAWGGIVVKALCY